MNDWDDIADEPPQAEVSRVGRWRWKIVVTHGLMIWGPGGEPFDCWGSRARADRVAARKLRAYLRAQPTETHHVRLN